MKGDRIMRMQSRDMETLLGMSLPEVLQAMLLEGGLSQSELGRRVGWSPGNVARIFDPNDDYWPTLGKLPEMCLQCRSTLILDWLRAQVVASGCGQRVRGLGADGLGLAVAEIGAAFGGVAREAAQALEDDVLEPTERRRIVRELRGLQHDTARTIAALNKGAEDGEGEAA